MPGNLPGNFAISGKFLAGNIAINKDENRKSSFMKVEALTLIPSWITLQT